MTHTSSLSPRRRDGSGCQEREFDEVLLDEDGAGPESLPLDPAASSRLTNSRATRHHGRHARDRPEAQGVYDQPVGLEDGCARRALEQTATAHPSLLSGPAQVSGGLSVRPTPAGSAMSACRGRPWPLLVIVQREAASDEIAWPEQNPTEVSGVDALINSGG
jgi:hypothetical protein